jgi:hypothetical protein
MKSVLELIEVAIVHQLEPMDHEVAHRAIAGSLIADR